MPQEIQRFLPRHTGYFTTSATGHTITLMLRHLQERTAHFFCPHHKFHYLRCAQGKTRARFLRKSTVDVAGYMRSVTTFVGKCELREFNSAVAELQKGDLCSVAFG